MSSQARSMTAEQIQQFLDYVDAELAALERSREERLSSGRLELAYYDKMELARLKQTKGMFLQILGK